MKKTGICAVLFAVFSFSLFAGPPRIVSVNMVPPNPGYGDLVNIYVTACVPKYVSSYIDIAISSSAARLSPGSAGQVFVVSSAGVNAARVNPNVGADEIGYSFAASNPAATNSSHEQLP